MKKVKILLVGEFSGVHYNLKKGLEQLGCNATVMANGDFFKSLHYDKKLTPYIAKNHRIRIVYIIDKFIERLLAFIYLIAFFHFNMKKYDVIQFINYQIHPMFFHKILIKYILKRHNNTILLACGCDSHYYDAIKEFRYSPCKQCTLIDKKGSKCSHSKSYMKSNQSIFDKYVKYIIPMCYDYDYSYKMKSKHTNKLKDLIPFPIEIKDIYINNNSDRKLNIYHPLNRTGFKGTKIIERVFIELNKKYGHIANFIIKGNMSYDEYLEFNKTVDILVDQSLSYSYGMAATIGLSQGKVVLSGLTNEVIEKFEFYKECPIINIEPNFEDIYKKIEYLIVNCEKITNIKTQGIYFANKYHNNVKIAKSFLNHYSILQ